MSHPILATASNALLRSLGGRLLLLCVILVALLTLAVAGVRNSLKGSVYAADDRVLVVGNRLSPLLPVPARDVNAIKDTVAGVEAVSGFSLLNGVMTDTREPAPTIIVGANFLRANPDLVVSGIDLSRWAADRGAALVGDDLARRENLAIGDLIKVDYGPRGSRLELTQGLRVGGIYHVRNDRYASTGLMLHDSLAGRSGQGPTAYSAILVKVAPTIDITTVAKQIDKLFAVGAAPTRSALRSEYTSYFNRQAKDFAALLNIAIGAVLTMTFIVSGSVLLTICVALGPTWAILQVLGFRRGELRILSAGVFTLEIFVTVLATELGATAVIAALHPAIRMVFPFFTIQARDYADVLVGGFAAALLVSLASVLGGDIIMRRSGSVTR